MRTHYHVDPSGSIEYASSIFLRQTTGYGNLHTRILSFRSREVSERSVELVISVLSDAARVKHHHIRRFKVFRWLHAISHKHAGETLRVMLVHLTTKGTNVKLLCHRLILRS